MAKKDNETPEQDFLNQLKLFCDKQSRISVISYNCSARNTMDFEATVEIDDDQRFILRCESKVFSKKELGKSYDNKNNALKTFFAELLLGQILAAPEIEGFDCVYYGVLITKRDYPELKKTYAPTMGLWDNFGTYCNCHFVVIFDDMNEELFFYNWENCWEEEKFVFKIPSDK